MSRKTKTLFLSLWALVAACDRSLDVPDEQRPALAGCELDATETNRRPVLAATFGPEVRVLLSDGSERVVHRFNGVAATVLAVRGGRLLAAQVNASGAPEGSVALIDLASGALRWERDEDITGGLLAADGRAFLKRTADGGAVVALDGTTSALPGLPEQLGAGEAVLLSRSPVGDEQRRQYGWWKPGFQSAQPLSPAPSDWSAPERGADGSAVYAAENGSTIVISTPDGARLVAAPADAGSVSVLGHGRYIGVMGSSEDQPRYKLDTVTGMLTRIDTSFPAGLREIERSHPTLFSEAGEVMLGLRNEGVGGLYTTSASGWVRVGYSVADVLAVSVAAERGGAVLINAHYDRFADPGPWPMAIGEQPELRGRSAQIARFDGSARHVINNEVVGSVRFDAAGACAVYAEPRFDSTSQLFLLRLRDGVKRAIGEPAAEVQATFIDP